MFGELYEDFIMNIPAPDYTSPKGVMNLASHFALNGIRPDLGRPAIQLDITFTHKTFDYPGPKLYNAYGSPPSYPHCGSTRLHLDMTDAVNVLLHAEPQSDGTPGGALWHIFRADDVDCMRQYLRKHHQTASNARRDPIHDQQTYLGAGDLSKLAELGVVPFTIFQHPGHAIFIPSGCPHQVRPRTFTSGRSLSDLLRSRI